MRIAASFIVLAAAGFSWAMSATSVAVPPPPPTASATVLGTAFGDALIGNPAADPAYATGIASAAPGRDILSGRDAPDAFLFQHGGRDYLFTSEGNLAHVNVPVVSGTSVGHWGPMQDAMPDPPPWVLAGFTWAPDVHQFGSTYVLYFTSDVVGTTPPDECIGEATGTSPDGPYTPIDHPFICQLSQRGSIDPRTFTDINGTTYMYWKSDENADSNGTSLTNIYAEPLSADGLTLVSKPTRIFGPDEPWQGRIVEAPDMVEANGTYWMFYSGGWFNQRVYAIGTARCAGPLGPCADVSAHPWFSSNLQGVGPGEQSVFEQGGSFWMLYAPWRSDDPHPTLTRPVDMVRIGFGPKLPYIAAPGPGTLPPAPTSANGLR